MPRKGSLSKKTYFPKPGDLLEDHVAGISWEAVRTNQHLDEVTGQKTRYGLLLGRHSEFPDDVIRMAIHDHDESPWLEDIAVIYRKQKGDMMKKYVFIADTETWQEDD